MSDYPTDEEIRKLEQWEGTYPDFMTYLKSLWWMPEWGWRETDDEYHISTGGWSGNEDLISAWENAQPLNKPPRLYWLFHWKQSGRGGHYIFDKGKR